MNALAWGAGPAVLGIGIFFSAFSLGSAQRSVSSEERLSDDQRQVLACAASTSDPQALARCVAPEMSMIRDCLALHPHQQLDACLTSNAGANSAELSSAEATAGWSDGEEGYQLGRAIYNAGARKAGRSEIPNTITGEAKVKSWMADAMGLPNVWEPKEESKPQPKSSDERVTGGDRAEMHNQDRRGEGTAHRGQRGESPTDKQ